jgi:hypothetical protein
MKTGHRKLDDHSTSSETRIPRLVLKPGTELDDHSTSPVTRIPRLVLDTSESLELRLLVIVQHSFAIFTEFAIFTLPW